MKISFEVVLLTFIVVIGSSIVSAINTKLRYRNNRISKEQAAAACVDAEEWDREDCIFDVLAVNDVDMASNFYRTGLQANLDRDEVAGDDTYDLDGLIADIYGAGDINGTSITRNDDEEGGNPIY